MRLKWLEEQESIVDEFRKKQKRQFPMVVGMSFFMIILFGVIGYINRETIPTENISNVIKIMGIIIVAISFVLIIGAHQNNKKGYPKLRENLEEVLITYEDVNQFDTEMMTAPLHKVQLKDGDGEYFFTKHYLVCKFGKVPLTEYNIFKLSEIHSTKSLCLRDRSSIMRLGREYFTNLCDKDRQILGGITIKKKVQHEKFIEDLQRFVPDVKLGEGR